MEVFRRRATRFKVLKFHSIFTCLYRQNQFCRVWSTSMKDDVFLKISCILWIQQQLALQEHPWLQNMVLCLSYPHLIDNRWDLNLLIYICKSSCCLHYQLWSEKSPGFCLLARKCLQQNLIKTLPNWTIRILFFYAR